MPRRGTGARGRDPGHRRFHVTGLLLDGWLRRGDRDRRIVAVPGTPVPGSTVLASAWEVVAEKGPKMKAVLSDMSRGLDQRLGVSTRDAVSDALVRAGIVARTGGLRPTWPLLDSAARDSVVVRLRAAAAGDGPIEPPHRSVLSMTGPGQLLQVVAPEPTARRHARNRIDHSADGSVLAPVATTVRQSIAAAAAAA